MTENPTGVRVETATVTDRGLNERRPLNEDSMLCDPAHSIFAVADGVGGAEAGEVASKAAIEILQQAFDGHAAGEDAEDLMEIAIQRANDQIYRQSREQPQLSMMATTIVALHVDGLRATVGHVGDSRLYSLTPDGTLRRETEDHSVVEEEVRAGRMTPEQAANHPSRNVISRALGAESSVEVDLRTFDFGSGTTFLLCSDGITRHIADDELAGLLQSVPDLEEACAEMKRLCFERGAEDNLTAVLVRVGGAGAGSHDEEATLIRERPSLDAARAAQAASTSPPTLRRPFNDAAAVKHESGAVGTSQNGGATSNVAPAAKRSGGALRAVAVLFLVAAAVAFAFFVGMMFERRGRAKLAGVLPQATPFPAVTPVPAPSVESPEARFAERLRAVDRDPSGEASRMEAAGGPLDSEDPELLYLYGRALLLTGRSAEAASAFDRTLARLAVESMTPHHGQLKIDAHIAAVAAHERSGNTEAARAAADRMQEVVRAASAPAGEGAVAQPSPGATP